ncbi:hypothetical protein CORC01_10684 [Colletotrichum orchidophilum]|uniref:Pentatricopeptide repeat domain-containing protein n=1 Tax=Colletotrichum orchidophilum TaxID=1209926 RepID=A0A1G4AY61_9PEZI|nr:uncharacterized protein CORC01_10684 [Colletotrichum orchidophilum]OHE93992.1 hypothetical protein CORC01_10684 [Colletotrichum orchidophilum]
MSLGITLSSRARSHCVGFSGISPISRASQRWSRVPPAQLPLSSQWVHAAADAVEPKSVETSTPRHRIADEGADHGTSAKATGAHSAYDAAVSPTLEGQTVEDGETETPSTTEKAILNYGPYAKQKRPRKPIKSRSSTSAPNNSSQPLEGVHVASLLKDAHGRNFKQPKKLKRGVALGQPDSILVTPVTHYRPLRETLLSAQRYNRSVTRQIWLEALREIKREPISNWRDTLDVLRLQTRPVVGPWQRNARKITVGVELAHTLLHDVDHTIWDLNEQTRCEIELRWPKDTDGTNISDVGYVLLSGDEEALEHASKEISRLAAQADSAISIEGAIGSYFSTTSCDKATGIREEVVWESSHKEQRPAYRKEYVYSQRYEDIPRPRGWTPDTFLAYITAITNANMRARVKSRLYGSGTAADNAAISLLHGAFADESARHAWSRRALKQALRFLELRGHSYRNHARDLFRSQLDAPFPMDTGVFNIMLEGCVKVKDLRNFDDVVKQMVRHGCRPNAKTWALLMDLIESKQVRQHVIRIMHSLGLLLEPSVVPLIAKQLVTNDMHQLEQDWPGIRVFLQSLTAKYGSSWASRSVMHVIMNELGRMGNFASCCDLWDIMTKSRDTFPTTLTLNTILHHACAQRNFALATAALQRAHEHYILLDESSYHALFSLAFRLNRPNAMGLIWRYACIAGKTSWHMRSRVTDLLAGVDPQLAMKHHGKSHPGEYASPSALPTFFDDSVMPPLQTNGARISTLMYDFFQKEKWYPLEPLHELLHKAWDVDSDIIKKVKQAKQQSQQQQQQQQSSPAPLPRTITVPGIKMYLKEPAKHRPKRFRLKLKITHLAPTDDYQPSSSAERDDDDDDDTRKTEASTLPPRESDSISA